MAESDSGECVWSCVHVRYTYGRYDTLPLPRRAFTEKGTSAREKTRQIPGGKTSVGLNGWAAAGQQRGKKDIEIRGKKQELFQI